MLHIGHHEEIAAELERASGADEVWEVVTTYRMYRHGKDVTIELRRRATGPYSADWMIIAEDEDGRRTTGNPHSGLDVAIATTHWHDLDADS